MEMLFKRIPLVAIGFAIARIACADPAASTSAYFTGLETRPPLSGFSPSPPPLRLATTLDPDRPRTPAVFAPPLARAQTNSASGAAPEHAESSANRLPPLQHEAEPVTPALTWEISPSDRTLSVALARWAQSAGWQLVWDMAVDYPIRTTTVLHGSFQDAVGAVAHSLADANIPIQATFYEGNKVLRIVARGSE